MKGTRSMSAPQQSLDQVTSSDPGTLVEDDPNPRGESLTKIENETVDGERDTEGHRQVNP